jgi:hypothetical protein
MNCGLEFFSVKFSMNRLMILRILNTAYMKTKHEVTVSFQVRKIL